MVNSKIVYRLPFSKQELKFFLENETIFKRQSQINIDVFVKNFFPEQVRAQAGSNQKQDSSETSESEDQDQSLLPTQNNRGSVDSPTKNGRGDEVTTSAGTSIFSGSLKSTNAAEQVKKLDAEL